MTQTELRSLALAVLAALIAIFLSACGTTTRALPAYEAPLTKREFQNIRTTAYTHTESDHREFSNHNALGGELHAAGLPIHRAENVARALPVSDNEEVDLQRVSNSNGGLQPFSMEERRTTTRVTTKGATKTSETKRAVAVVKRTPKVGSAAADWSRWPMGTTFRLLSTGQIYRVDDYGWALSGRNTIDLYMATAGDMNNWGVRQESIQILQWGDAQDSLRLLARRQNYPHIKRMVLELEDREQEAAALH